MKIEELTRGRELKMTELIGIVDEDLAV